MHMSNHFDDASNEALVRGLANITALTDTDNGTRILDDEDNEALDGPDRDELRAAAHAAGFQLETDDGGDLIAVARRF